MLSICLHVCSWEYDYMGMHVCPYAYASVNMYVHAHIPVHVCVHMRHQISLLLTEVDTVTLIMLWRASINAFDKYRQKTITR